MTATLNTQALKQLDQAHHLHPFTDFEDYAKHGGRIVSRAEHIYIYDSDGNKIQDGMSGLWCCNLGYSQDRIKQAVAEQLAELPFYNNFFRCSNQPAAELAARLSQVTPERFQHVFFTNSGSEANDTQIKLVHRYFDLLGKPEKKLIISRQNAYHGSTIAASTLGGMSAMHKQTMGLDYVHHIQQPHWFEEGADLDPDAFGIAAARELEKKIDELGEHRVAAFIAEPVQGAGGVIVPPESYWPEVKRILDERDILLISDEVICGFGRTGKWFGFETYGVEPDLVTFAKAVTNGFQPLGGVMVSKKVADVVTASGGEFGHGFTYSGHPIACAAALATINIITRDNMVDVVANDIGPYLQNKWAALAEHPIVGHVRGVGMLGSIELVRNKQTRERLEPEQKSGAVCREFCIANGLVMRAVGDSMIISPPFVSSHAEIDLLIERATRALDATAQHYQIKGS